MFDRKQKIKISVKKKKIVKFQKQYSVQEDMTHTCDSFQVRHMNHFDDSFLERNGFESGEIGQRKLQVVRVGCTVFET